MLTMLDRLIFRALSNLFEPLRVQISKYFSAVASERLPVPLMYFLTLTRPFSLRTSPDLVINSTVQNCPVAARDCAIFMIETLVCLAIVPEIALCFKDYFGIIDYRMSWSIISRKTQIVPLDTKSIKSRLRILCMIKPYFMKRNGIQMQYSLTLKNPSLSQASDLSAKTPSVLRIGVSCRKCLVWIIWTIFYPFGFY